MSTPEERAERLSHEIDRYLLAASEPPQTLHPEDEPELSLGVQLLQSDYSSQSKVRNQLRRNLDLERGIHYLNSSQKLIKAASSKQLVSLINWRFWPALFALVIILSIWSWKTASSSVRSESYSLHPSPALLVTAVLSTSQQSMNYDPIPLPTPLAPFGVIKNPSSSVVPVVQNTPFSIAYQYTDTVTP